MTHGQWTADCGRWTVDARMQTKIMKTFKNNVISRKFTEFCRRTDLHGYKYLVMDQLTYLERWCWGAALLSSLVCAGYFVLTAYRWYARNPIVTVIESTHGAIWDIPYPSVTFCDLNLVSLNNARKFVDRIRSSTNVTAENLLAWLHIAPLVYNPLTMTSGNHKSLIQLQNLLDTHNISMKELFFSIGPNSCNQFIERCSWKNAIYRCEHLFERILAHHSLCCSFNYLALDPLPGSRSKGGSWSETPRRVASCGYQTALSVLLNNPTLDYFSTTVSSYGSMVYIDNAYNSPNIHSSSRVLNPRTEVFISLVPETTYTTPGVATFNSHNRQCLYGHEISLGRYKQYSYHNCMSHRAALKILKICGCVQFFITSIEGTNRTCNFKDLPCITRLQKRSDFNTNINSPVECLPDCEHYDYPLEVAVGVIVSDAPSTNLAFFKDTNIKNHTVVNVFFNDLVSTRYRRDVYLNWQNLLASFGGLMSLMLGFTLISGFDMVIFIVFRVMGNGCRGCGSTTRVSQVTRELQMTNREYYLKEALTKYKLKHAMSPFGTNIIIPVAIQGTTPSRYEHTGRF